MCCDRSKSSLTKLAPLEAVLFDIDGTLCDSDPIHYHAFREMLQEVLFLFFAVKFKAKYSEYRYYTIYHYTLFILRLVSMEVIL